MCVVDTGDRCSVWAESRPKARKRHICDSCRRVIEPGETYLVVFSVFEGVATNSKACPGCEAIIGRFADGHDGIRFSPHDIGFMIGECLADYFNESDALHYIQDLDWINLGRWLHRKNKFNRTLTSEQTCHF